MSQFGYKVQTKKFSARLSCFVHRQNGGADRDCEFVMVIAEYAYHVTFIIASPKFLAAPNPRTLATCLISTSNL